MTLDEHNNMLQIISDLSKEAHGYLAQSALKAGMLWYTDLQDIAVESTIEKYNYSPLWSIRCNIFDSCRV